MSRPAALARMGRLLLRSAPPWATRPGGGGVQAAWGVVGRGAAASAAAAAAEPALAAATTASGGAAAAATSGRPEASSTPTSSSPSSSTTTTAPGGGGGGPAAAGEGGTAAGAAPVAPTALTPTAPIPEVVGRVQSLESFSTVDGPGIRMVVFLSGCAMRCVFCSNPDTWSSHGGTPTSSKEIAAHLKRLKPFLAPGGGGITCSGGEPLLQPEFVAALFKEARALGLTTVLDTTGQGTRRHNWEPVLPHTDMVLFCVKSLDPRKYALLTGLKQRGALKFAEELLERRVPFWVRYVLIPGWTDGEGDVGALGQWARDLYERSGGGGGGEAAEGGAADAGGGGAAAGGGGGAGLSASSSAAVSSPLAAGAAAAADQAPPPPENPPPSPVFQGIELLPYHVLGRAKWQALGLKYPLEGVATPKPVAVLPVVRRLRAEFGVPVLCAVDERTAGAAAAAGGAAGGGSGGGSSAVDVDSDDVGHARHIGPRPA